MLVVVFLAKNSILPRIFLIFLEQHWFLVLEKSALFKEKSELLEEIFIVQEDLNNADFSLSADLKDQKSDLLKENAEKIAEIKYIWNQRWFKDRNTWKYFQANR